MNIRITGTKEELDKVIDIICKATTNEFIVSKLYPNRGSKEYRIYLNKVVTEIKK